MDGVSVVAVVMAVNVDGFIAILKVTASFVLMATSVAPFAGVTELTVVAVEIAPGDVLFFPPHPTARATRSTAVNHTPMEYPVRARIGVSSGYYYSVN
jgi:hypothetical protein